MVCVAHRDIDSFTVRVREPAPRRLPDFDAAERLKTYAVGRLNALRGLIADEDRLGVD